MLCMQKQSGIDSKREESCKRQDKLLPDAVTGEDWSRG